MYFLPIVKSAETSLNGYVGPQADPDHRPAEPGRRKMHMVRPSSSLFRPVQDAENDGRRIEVGDKDGRTVVEGQTTVLCNRRGFAH